MTNTTPAKSREHAELERQHRELQGHCAKQSAQIEVAKQCYSELMAAYAELKAKCDAERAARQAAEVLVGVYRTKSDTAEYELDELRAEVAKRCRGYEMDSAGVCAEVGDGE